MQGVPRFDPAPDPAFASDDSALRYLTKIAEAADPNDVVQRETAEIPFFITTTGQRGPVQHDPSRRLYKITDHGRQALGLPKR